MGACGCGGDSFDFQMPGPDGSAYALRVYRSCSGCHTPLGIDVVLVRPDSEDREFLTGGVPPMPFGEESYGQAWCSIPLLDPEHLVSEMSVEADEDGLAELSVGAVAAALPAAIGTTLRGWDSGDTDTTTEGS